MADRPILVTQPYMPPIEEFVELVRGIWDRRIVSNFGPVHQEFEAALCAVLGVEDGLLVSSGTAGLVAALLALPTKGEVITTPFSFAATATAISATGHTPVFVDIDARDLNIDPESVVNAISKNTVAIMPVHCFGQACKVDSLERISRSFDIPLVYDAAHAFGVQRSGKSILEHGAVSVVSLHATKVLSSVEGGFVVCNSPRFRDKIRAVRNFGFVDVQTLRIPGMNLKLNEFSAAFGLLQLRHLDEMMKVRRKFFLRYQALVPSFEGLTLPLSDPSFSSNFSYFPVLVGETAKKTRDELFDFLSSKQIVARKYFWPLLSAFEAFDAPTQDAVFPVAERASQQILCLPLHANLDETSWSRIEDALGEALS